MLDGCKVLDCSGEVGWLAGRVLADLGADVVKVEPPGADVDGVDWQAFNVNKRLVRLDPTDAAMAAALDRLIAAADVLVESATPGAPEAAPFDPERLAGLNPRLVHVSVTPFGSTGPRARWRASDIEVMAAGGALSLAGEPDGMPVRVSAPQARCWAGAQAAVGALVALHERASSGRGQHVDTSAQASVVQALAHAPTFWDLLGTVPTRCGAFVTGRSIAGARYRAFWPCADGHINFVLYGGPAGRRTNRHLVEWMGEAGADLGALAEVDWEAFDPKLATQEQVDRLEEPIGRFLATLTKAEFLEGASAREMLGYPVATVADIARDPQPAARGFWDDVVVGGGATQRHCGAFAIVDGERPPIRHAPGAPTDADAVLAQWSEAPVAGTVGHLRVAEGAE